MPSDIVGVPSINNAEPLMNRYNTSTSVVMKVVNRTDTEMEFATDIASSHGNTYFGGILSANREVVYWMNDSKPLP